MADTHQALDRITRRVAAFDASRQKIRLPDTSRVFFVEASQDRRARTSGEQFWLPLEKTYRIFVCAYSALFAIPAFTNEALARQHDRFSLKRLPLTIRNTSSFILDAFGYDRRTERARKILYSPTPSISSNHRETGFKARITDPAMAYFGVNLIRLAERDAVASDEDIAWHFDYLAGFFRNAGYAFPDRTEAKGFMHEVDRNLPGDEHKELWSNSLHAATTLGVELGPEDIAASLPERSGQLFRSSIPRPKEVDREA
jgi:hypothetical protein